MISPFLLKNQSIGGCSCMQTGKSVEKYFSTSREKLYTIKILDCPEKLYKQYFRGSSFLRSFLCQMRPKPNKF